MTQADYYVLNANEGTDTLHRNPREECNVDDAKGRQTIDFASAVSLLLKGSAVRCQHCMGEEASL